MLICEPKPAPSRSAYSTRWKPPRRQVQRTELGVDLLEVRDRRDEAGLQRLDRHDVLDADAHRVAGEPLGVGDHDPLGRRRRRPGAARAPPPRRCRRARACRSRARRTRAAARSSRAGRRCAPRRCATSVLHHLPDVLDVEPRAVEGAVGRHRAPATSQIGCEAALARRRRRSRRRSPPRPCRGSCRGGGGRTAGRPPRRRRRWRRRRSTGSRRRTTRAGGRWSRRRPATMTTRRQRPAWIQSSASATACVVLAHAEFTCVFGPRAPISSANCEWPMASTRNRKRRSNA